jgi:hypothetical protein
MATALSGSQAGPASAAEGRLLLLNSAVAFAIALPLMTTVHELAHAVVMAAQGLRPRVYPGQVVSAVQGTTDQQVVHLLAGPAGSLLIGVAILLAVPAASGFWRLCLLWFGALSVQEFTGYLMTAPFLSIGDVGAALHLVAAPAWAYWLCFVAGGLGTVLLGRHFTGRLLALVDPAGDRATQLRSLGLFAWLLGAAVCLGYGLVAALVSGGSHDVLSPVGLVEALATLTSGIFVFAVRLFMGGEVAGRGLSVGWGWPVIGVAIFLAVNVGRTLILGPGLQL